MKHGLSVLLAVMMSTGATFAAPGASRAYYVRYAINMDFLPPLIGEARCIALEPCDIVKLDHFSLTLTIQVDRHRNDQGRLEINCSNRACALGRGQRWITYRKTGRLVRFDVDDREYAKDSLAVMRYRGNVIGQILLAY